jgi:hypothetical protein
LYGELRFGAIIADTRQPFRRFAVILTCLSVTLRSPVLRGKIWQILITENRQFLFYASSYYKKE